MSSGFSQAILEGADFNDAFKTLDLSGFPEGPPEQADFVLSDEVEQQQPGIYECRAVVVGNSYDALTRHALDPPQRFWIVEHPDDVREEPEVLSVGEIW